METIRDLTCCFCPPFQAADSRRRQIADGIDNLEEEAANSKTMEEMLEHPL